MLCSSDLYDLPHGVQESQKPILNFQSPSYLEFIGNTSQQNVEDKIVQLETSLDQHK